MIMINSSTCAKVLEFLVQVLEFFWPSTVRVLGKHVGESKLQCLFISNDDAYTHQFKQIAIIAKRVYIAVEINIRISHLADLQALSHP